jgi:hypothetical protein
MIINHLRDHLLSAGRFCDSGERVFILGRHPGWRVRGLEQSGTATRDHAK